MVFEGVQVKGSVEETLQLQKMGVLVASGWGSGRLTASIPVHRKTVKICDSKEQLQVQLYMRRHVYQTGLARSMVVRMRGLT